MLFRLVIKLVIVGNSLNCHKLAHPTVHLVVEANVQYGNRKQRGCKYMVEGKCKARVISVVGGDSMTYMWC